MVCLRWQSFSLACTRDCLFVRNRYLPIAGNEGIHSVVTRIVQGTTNCPSFLWWNLGFTLPEVIIAKTKKDILNFPQESNYNSLRLIWRRGLRSPLFRRLSAGWGMHRSAMSLDLLASLSHPNVIREDLPKHHLVIIKINIQYNHRKEYLNKKPYRIRVVRLEQSYNFNDSKRSISLSLSVFPLPSFRNKPFA
ncbi:hypothetical protein VNO77_37839 [Canavalia gladiata]|uniref:Uncharacterized protein n=1 Tax=Canavalia gladiata TaxID=3824 RepID=A0AAN9KAE4_CANGL